MVQNKKRMVKELLSAERTLMEVAAYSIGTKAEKRRPRIMKKGAPGGCPTSSLYAVAMNSPQSQKLEVGSMV